MEDYAHRFIDNVSDYMARHELTPTAFSREIGCRDSCVLKWLKGYNTPSLEYIILVADRFKVSVDYLLGLVDEDKLVLSTKRASFAARFELLLEKKPISKNRLAKMAGVTSSTVSKWLMHGQLPKVDVLVKLSNYFCCSTDYLVGRSDIE